MTGEKWVSITFIHDQDSKTKSTKSLSHQKSISLEVENTVHFSFSKRKWRPIDFWLGASRLIVLEAERLVNVTFPLLTIHYTLVCNCLIGEFYVSY